MGCDILLINPGGSRKRIYQALSTDYSAVDTPFWAALTAGYLRKQGFTVEILDANADNLNHDETVAKVQESSPRYIAIVCYSQQANACTPIMVSVGELCRKIKELIPERNLLLTGWHPSALPERTMRDEACDFVIQGEGFYGLSDLLAGKSFKDVRGLWWKQNNTIMSNGRPGNISDLTEELSHVAWDLLPLCTGKYRAFNWMCLGDMQSRNRSASMLTSLGCPFHCNFCAIHATYGERRLRCWNTEWVLSQFEELAHTYNVKNVNLNDELFIYNRKHYYRIAEGIIARGLVLNIASFARVDTLDRILPEELSFLKKAGFNWFKLGIESGNEKILQENKKGAFTKDVIRRVVEKTHAAGIDICANFIFGLPGDTLETMQENLDFALELKCTFPSFFCAMAVPGSDLYETALQMGVPLPETWLGYAAQGYDFLPLPTETLSAAEILRFRDEAFDRYFTDKEYLTRIERRFGKDIVKHILGMTEIKLKRRILENH